MFFDSHMHTPLCKHAYGDPQDYAEAAIEAGLDGIIFTCHSPMPDGWFERVRMAPEEFDHYVAMIEQCRDEFEGRLDVRLGLESDWFPGMEDWLRELHESADFDFVLGSVHFFGGEWMDSYFKDLEPDQFVKQYFEQLALSAESGLFDSLAHPDLVKNRVREHWDFERYRDTIAEALDRIAVTGVAMELNTSGTHKPFPEVNPGQEMLSMMCEWEIPVTLGSDSHVPTRVGDGFLSALIDFEMAGYEEIRVYEKRKPQPVRIAEFREALSEPAW